MSEESLSQPRNYIRRLLTRWGILQPTAAGHHPAYHLRGIILEIRGRLASKAGNAFTSAPCATARRRMSVTDSMDNSLVVA